MGLTSYYFVEPLNRDNYHTWKEEAKAVLIENGLWGYVDGTKPVPHSFLGRIEHEEKDAHAMSELLLMISPSVLEHVENFLSSKMLWDSLETMYQQEIQYNPDAHLKIALLKRLLLIKLDEEDDVRDHLNEFTNTAEVLAEMDVVIDDDLLSVMMLKSLSPSYDKFCSTIESLDLLPPPQDLKIEIIAESYLTRDRIDASASANCSDCGRTKQKVVECHCSDTTNTAQPACFSDLPKPADEKWYLDSGCTAHMSGDIRNFHNMTNYEGTSAVKLGSEMFKAAVKGIGSVTLNMPECKTELNGAVYVPSLSMNLMSVSKITDQGYSVLFESDYATVRSSDGKTILKAEREDGLYALNAKAKSNQTTPLFQRINKTQPQEQAVPSPPTREILDIVHSDIWGPMEYESVDGAKYFVTFIDDVTRMCHVYFIKSRFEVFDKFVEYKTMIEKFTEKKIMCLKTYKKRHEYCSARFNEYLQTKGIRRILSNEIDVVLRRNMMLAERSERLIRERKFEKKYWDDAMYTANYWLNRTPMPALGYKTPEEIWVLYNPPTRCVSI